MPPSLVEQLREVGLAMGARYANGWYVGWTVDAAKAERARQLGAEVHGYVSSDPAFSGWEVRVHDPA